MSDSKIVADIDAGKSIVIKKKIAYSLILAIFTGIVGWLVTVIFWVAGTTNAIADNVKGIDSNKQKIIKLDVWKIQHTDGQYELIYNLKRLLESNGLEWKVFKK